jgi:hypothetical protein
MSQHPELDELLAHVKVLRAERAASAVAYEKVHREYVRKRTAWCRHPNVRWAMRKAAVEARLQRIQRYQASIEAERRAAESRD